MNIAYLISAHTDAPQLKRLIEALHSDAEFFIHIDSKSDLSAFTEQIVLSLYQYQARAMVAFVGHRNFLPMHR